MKVSVALATYNGTPFLREQLASLVGQTRRPDELVVSDDGSSDSTLELIKAFANSAPFDVVIVKSEGRLGFADNFLFAAEQCSGEVIAFCDQDDVWLPLKIEAGLRRIEQDGSLITMHRLFKTDAQLALTGVWTQDIHSDRVFEALELDPFATGWGNSMMFRRELLEVFPRERRPRQPLEPHRPLSHDTWIYTLGAALGRVSHDMTPLILYRQHGANSVGFDSRRRPSRLKKAMTVPIALYAAREKFFSDMAALFEDAARSLPLGDPVATAARRYRERQTAARARLDIFTAPSASERLAAYRAWPSFLPGKPWVGSRAKDFLFGVCGANKVPPIGWGE